MFVDPLLRSCYVTYMHFSNSFQIIKGIRSGKYCLIGQRRREIQFSPRLEFREYGLRSEDWGLKYIGEHSKVLWIGLG